MVRPLAVGVEDRQDLYRSLDRADGMRGHGGELSCLTGLDGDLPITQVQQRLPGQDREPLLARVHGQVSRTVAATARDAHLRHHRPAGLLRPGQQPCGQTRFPVRHGMDQYILVLFGLDEVVDGGAQCPSQGHQLFKADAALSGLDPAQCGRAHLAARRQCVQAPATGLPEPADALADHLGEVGREAIRGHRHHRTLRIPQDTLCVRGGTSTVGVMPLTHNHHKSTAIEDGQEHPDPGHAHDHGQAQILDLDAKALADDIAAITAWLPVQAAPMQIVDLGAGTGAGSFALLNQFPQAQITAVDSSSAHLERLRTTAHKANLTHRVRIVQADLNAGEWPDLGTPDLVWASASMHHLAAPDQALRKVRDILAPAGLIVIVELAGLPASCPPPLRRTGPAWKSAATPPPSSSLPSTCRIVAPTGDRS